MYLKLNQIKKSNFQQKRRQMSKQKKVRRIVLDKLYDRKQVQMKKSTRSNAPTQSTPNQIKYSSKNIQNFFYNFDIQCAIIYEPVKLKDKKPVKRNLQDQLKQLFLLNQQSKIPIRKIDQNINKKEQLRSYLKKTSSTYIKYITQPSSSKYKSKIQLCNVKKTKQFTQSLSSSISPQVPKISPKISNNNTSRISSQNSLQIFQSKNNSPKLRTKILKQKNTQQQNLMMSSKCLPHTKLSKNQIKYAPKKVYQNYEKTYQNFQRIKRIQSLRNLNQNAIRKYSYQKQIS